MNNKRINIADKARKLESILAATIEGSVKRMTRSPSRQPLEIVLAVVDAVEMEAQPSGRGQRAFPFNRIHVQLPAASDRAKAHLELACEGPPSLQQRILERLRSAGCTVGSIDVSVSFGTEAQATWSHPDFDIEYKRAVSGTAAPQPVRLELTVTHGTADRTVYVFEAGPIALGRGDEVRDRHQRLLRTNQIAFAEGGDEVNGSVSRRHARIEQDASCGAYRLYDDGSAQGTSVIRGGRGLHVARGARGLRLQSGDEIVLGQARLHVKI